MNREKRILQLAEELKKAAHENRFSDAKVVHAKLLGAIGGSVAASIIPYEPEGHALYNIACDEAQAHE